MIDVRRPDRLEPLRFVLERELISINRVEGDLLRDSDIGIISIKGFHEKVKPRMDEVLAELKTKVGRDGLGGLVLDLRGNPGGFLNQAVKVADTFLSAGDIVTTVNGDGQQTDIDGRIATPRRVSPLSLSSTRVRPRPPRLSLGLCGFRSEP